MGLTQSHTRYIMWAAQDGRLNDLLYHLRGAKPESLNFSGLSPKRQAPIHLAAIGGHSMCIQALKEAGSKLNEQDKDGYAPLHLAVAHCHLGCVCMLLQLGANVNTKTRFLITPLHVAASVGHTPCIEELVRWGADINSQESWGQTPLIIATLKTRVHCMKALIHFGANIEIKDHHHKNTALHIACSTKDEEAVLILLDAGANVLSINGSGRSPLGVALENKFYSVVPLLIEYGARLNKKDRYHISHKLEEDIDIQTGTPISLLRLSRVVVRQMLGPATFEDMLPTFNLPSSLESFIRQMMDLCNYKQATLQDSSGQFSEASSPAGQFSEASSPAGQFSEASSPARQFQDSSVRLVPLQDSS